MKSKISFFNKGIILDDIRRFGWISAAYTMVLIFLLPLKIFMLCTNERINNVNNINMIKDLLYFRGGGLQGIFALIVPVLLAIFIFRYIQVKISVDMIHSLPIKRNTLYRSHIAFAVVSLVAPVIINALIIIILNKVLGLGQYYGAYDAIQWSRIMILFPLVSFFVAVFMGMVTGSSVLQGVLTYIFMFLPFGLTLLISETLKLFIYGFAYNVNEISNKLSPIVRIFDGFGNFDFNNKNLTLTEVTLYILLCIILYFISQFVYNIRKLEAASNPIAFKSLQYVFKYGVTFCAMLVGGAYFQAVQNSDRWIFFGFFIGSLIGYFVAEVIVKKSLWVFKSIKGYGIYIVVMIIVSIGIRFDITGYENRIPALDNVESIYFSEYYNLYSDKYSIDLYSDEKNLQSIESFHKKLIEDKHKNKNLNRQSTRSVVFQYRLNNGNKIQRSYNISYDDYVKYFKPIYESKEFKNMKYDVFSLDSADVEKITLRQIGDSGIGKGTVILKPEDIKEAIEVLKQDINNETYEQMKDDKPAWSEMSFMIAEGKLKKYPRLTDSEYRGGDKQAHLSWEKSYVLFEEWLRKKGYLENSRILPKDIGYAVVEKVQNEQQLEGKLKMGTDITGSSVKRLEITDKDKVETCLRTYNYHRKDGGAKYLIGFYNHSKQNIDFGVFTEDNAPDFVRAYFKE
ncbi:DUF6449 domain-containing protein [Clostridium sp. CX1]|uniref:DUF6449 domain-containing protein n=1 Tax=Clostridium sp. CX1 TaxID=2978346 RepID=UPI0021BE4FC5|nr:DUF6449 domain-containing protein [Clostridium sp. CX1]MCT8977433.1 DUF6449 domain-containing protein [Clostridium sp. CX1]